MTDDKTDDKKAAEPAKPAAADHTPSEPMETKIRELKAKYNNTGTVVMNLKTKLDRPEKSRGGNGR